MEIDVGQPEDAIKQTLGDGDAINVFDIKEHLGLPSPTLGDDHPFISDEVEAVHDDETLND